MTATDKEIPPEQLIYGSLQAIDARLHGLYVPDTGMSGHLAELKRLLQNQQLTPQFALLVTLVESIIYNQADFLDVVTELANKLYPVSSSSSDARPAPPAADGDGSTASPKTE